MTIITFPAGLAVGEVSIGQARYDMLESSDATGAQQSRLFGPPRWRVSLASPPALEPTPADLWESLVLRMRGGVNRLALHDVLRPTPRGTMRGSPSLAADTAAGATSASLAASGTLLTGDWLQFGSGIGTSQLVKLVADGVSGSGTISITFEPPLRVAFASGTAVVWDKPLAYYRLVAEPNPWRYLRGGRGHRAGFALDMLESFS